MSKFQNFKTEGYDSKKEYRRAQELQLLEKIGEISKLDYQVPYELIPKQVNEHGKTIERSVVYRADFRYEEGGSVVVEDCKGVRTREYVIKRKLMLHKFGIKIRET